MDHLDKLFHLNPLKREVGELLIILYSNIHVQYEAQRMIAVLNHFRNASYIGSMKPFSVSVSQDCLGNLLPSSAGAPSNGPPARRNSNLLPSDLSRVESAVLELNDQDGVLCS